jgi:DNA helicase-2/ATP-dependent DNA helicase PcrA
MDAAAALVLKAISEKAGESVPETAVVPAKPASSKAAAAELTPGEPVSAALGSVAARWAHEAELLLERHKRRKTVQDVHLPGHISASTFVDLGDDPAAVLAQLRRPVPREPGAAARKGTAFHAWVEEYYGTTGMLDLDEAPGSDSHIDEAYGLDQMVARFKESEWAHRAPAFVEVPVETRIGDVVVRGRIDAVFRTADGSWELVDWKTGKRPSEKQLRVKAVQLAVYRLAWARLKGVPVTEVSAAFYYLADDAVVRPHDLATEREMEALVERALKQ